MEFLRDLFYNGNPIYTVGQVLGIITMMIGFFIYYSKKRSSILMIKLVVDVLSIAQQLMIGASTGAMLNGIAAFREIVFYNRFSKKWAASPAWLWIFLILMGSSPILTWSGAISILPAAGSMLIALGFYMKDPTKIRIIVFFGRQMHHTAPQRSDLSLKRKRF